MKLGVISDVHGDLAGLEAALRVLERRGADAIVCCGDLVDRGPEPDAVVARILSEAIPCVRGNHDAEALQTGETFSGTFLDGVRRTLSQDSMAALAALPTTLSLTLGEHTVRVAHGTPWSEIVYLFEDSDPALLTRVAAEAGADIVLLGHTHTPMVLHADGVTVLNPGSVLSAFPRDSGTCGLLTLPEGRFEILPLRDGRDG